MAALFILVTPVVVVVLWLLFRRRSVDLPSPPGQLVVGNLLQIIRPRSDMWLAELSKKLGPIFSVRLLHMDLVVANDYDSIHAVLVKRGKEFAGRPTFFTRRLRFLRDDQPGMVVDQPSVEWKFLRETIHVNLRKYEKGLRRLESVNMAAIEHLMSELTRRAKEGPVEPRALIHNTIMNTMCVFLIGRTFPDDHPVFLDLMEIIDHFIVAFSPGSEGSELEVMWWLRHFGTKNYKKLQRAAEKTRDLWGRVLQLVEQDLAADSEDHDGIVHDLLAAVRDKKSSVPDSATEATVMGAFYDVLIGSVSSVGKTFHAFLNIMACYPEVQARLWREVDDVVGAERAVSLDDRQSMPYTRAALIELNRYASIGNIGALHSALVDTSINGHNIPKNTPVLTNLWALHHDEKFWGDPWEFRPERFLDDQGELLLADHERRRHVLAFGAGPRVCIGESLALGRVFLLMSTAVQRFELLPGPSPVSCDARLYVGDGDLSQTDYKLRLIPRQSPSY